MTSIGSFTRQVTTDSSHYISIAPLTLQVFTSPLGLVAPWASTGALAAIGKEHSIKWSVLSQGTAGSTHGQWIFNE